MKGSFFGIFRKAGIAALCAVLLAFTLSSCATVSSANKSFYDDNTKDFVFRTLDNGIPVVIKLNDSNRICNMQILVSGGAAAVPLDKAGIEAVVFGMMTRGSLTASRADILDTVYRTSSSINGGTSTDFSLLSLNCIDYHFDELFPIFIDCFLNPSFSESEFTTIMNESRQNIESTMADPFSLLMYTGKETIYKGHPYESMPTPMKSSIGNITLDAVKKHHKEILNAERIAVIAVGNYDPDDLFEKLNATLGKLPAVPYKPPVITALNPGGPVVTVESDTSKDIAYVAGFFAAPPQNSEDYPAFAIAASMLDDILFNVVREKYGATYSIGTTSFSGFTPAAAVYVFKAMDLTHLKEYLDEAFKTLSDGNIIQGKDENGNYIYGSVEERLHAYKNKYTNSFFSSVQTNGGTASRIINGLVYYGDPEAYLTYTDRINDVTAEDILDAFDTYFVNNPKQWVVVSDKNGIAQLDKAAYDTEPLMKN